MTSKQETIPDHTAVRVALWRAMHVQVDPSPHILEDEIGLKLIAPDANWRERPDMHPQGTRGYRASIVARARFIEDLLLEQIHKGVNQYVILGAGLDTFAQRSPNLAGQLNIFEVDQPATQAWKKQRLKELGFGIPNHLHLVPVNFEAGESWIQKLKSNGFDASKPAMIASTGVTMYLTQEANLATLKEISKFAAGTIFAMTFMLPTDMVEPAERPMYEMVQERARAAGTPFLSLFTPEAALNMAKETGFKDPKHISRTEIIRRYFTNRTDGLVPASGEEFLITKN